MKFYGSLVNRIHESVKQRDAVVGDGATLFFYSDRRAGTVIAVDEKTSCITVQEDFAERIDNNGMSDMQEYAYHGDEFGTMYFFKKDKNQRYRQVRHNTKTNRWNFIKDGVRVGIGYRDHYHDFSF